MRIDKGFIGNCLAAAWWAVIFVVMFLGWYSTGHCETKHVDWDGRPVLFSFTLKVQVDEPVKLEARVDWGDGDHNDYSLDPGTTITLKAQHIYFDKGKYDMTVVFYRENKEVYRKDIVIYISEVQSVSK